jgi:multiple sugar transport system substrate-binding protein
MVRRKEQEYLLQEAWRQQLLRGEIDRRQLLSRALVAGLGMAGVGVAARFGVPTARAQRPLTPTFYQWIEDLHPSIPQVNARFPDIDYQIAPVEGFGIERFVAEAKNGESTWDVYVGMTPFVEMTAMIEADVIEPWDNYIPKEVIDDMIPSIREECTVDGKLYSWPFLLDVIGMGWHSSPRRAARDLGRVSAERQGARRFRCRTLWRHFRRPRLALAGTHDPQHEQRRLHQ